MTRHSGHASAWLGYGQSDEGIGLGGAQAPPPISFPNNRRPRRRGDRDGGVQASWKSQRPVAAPTGMDGPCKDDPRVFTAEMCSPCSPPPLSLTSAFSGGKAVGSPPIDLYESETVRTQQLDKMLRDFKTAACSHSASLSSHDHRCCPSFHGDRDRRRHVMRDGKVLYCAEPCNEQFDSQRCCSKGDDCGYCHSTAELLYHPDVFRKRLCYQAKRCPRGRYCAFAHSRQELLVPHFGEMDEADPTEDFIAHKFKTQWCPIGGPHDWENCVYAHTYRDWRRSPLIGYSSRPCPLWTRSIAHGSPELNYDERCPRGMACPLAHGSKEQLYHPQFYKTSPCSETYCKRGSLCAFTHGPHDTRTPTGEEPDMSSFDDPRTAVTELLQKYQPTYKHPPKYHQLEDSSRALWGTHSFKQRGSRRRSNHREEQMPLPIEAPQQQQQQLHQPQVALPTNDRNLERNGWNQQGEMQQNEYSVYPMVMHPQAGANNQFFPDMFQWVPYSDAPNSPHMTAGLSAQLMNYGSDGRDPWAMQMGYAPMVWDASIAQLQAADPWGMQMMQQNLKPSKNGKVPKGQVGWKEMAPSGYPGGGMRTPSSLGSPPMSATPTEAPSPRHEEATGSGGSGEVSSDDTVREAMVKAALSGGAPVALELTELAPRTEVFAPASLC